MVIIAIIGLLHPKKPPQNRLHRFSGKYVTLNEFYILVLGLECGNLLNLYMPTNQKTIDLFKRKTDNLIKIILLDISNSLKCNCVSIKEKANFRALKEIVEKGRLISLQDYNNSLMDRCNENLNFFSLRRRQYRILTRMRMCFKRVYITHENSIIISDFIMKVANNVEIEEKTTPLLLELQELKRFFSKFPLPKTREEFENRAVLFQLLQEMEEFLKAKIELKKNYKY